MRVNSISGNRYNSSYNNNNTRNTTMPYRPSGNLSADTVSFKGITTKAMSEADLKNIVQLIIDSDESRLDGTIQGLYQYGQYMVKSPDAVNATPIKEFYALKRIETAAGKEHITPLSAALSQTGGRFFLVEEFIPGVHAAERPITFNQVKEMLYKSFVLDKSGVANQELSPRNIMILQDGSSRIIDFDTFAFVREDGTISHSKGISPEYFGARIPTTQCSNAGYLKAYQEMKKPKKMPTIDEMFASSFAHKRRLSSGLHELSSIRGMSENPYVNVPSNLTNYEAQTIYRRLLNGDIDNPVEFLRCYLQEKSVTYHANMKKYLETLSVPPEICDSRHGRLNLSTAQQRLQEAIEYEDFLSHVFEEKPDVYFAKLQAAKMQLEAMLQSQDYDKYVENKEQLHSAYEKLIKVLSEGLESYQQPQYQKYLKTELARYTEAFSGTDFALTTARTELLGRLDVVEIWFDDKAIDSGSFQQVRRNIRDAAIKAAKNLKKSNSEHVLLTPEELLAKQKVAAEVAAQDILGNLNGRLAPKQLEIARKLVVADVRDAIRKGALDPTQVPEEVMDAAEMVRSQTVRTAASRMVDDSDDKVRRVVDSVKGAALGLAEDDKIASYGKKYKKQMMDASGGRIIKYLGAFAAIAGVLACAIIKFKKDQKEEQEKRMDRVL